MLKSHNAAVALRIEGPLRLEALDRSLSELPRRHPILLARFEERQGRLVPRSCSTAPLALYTTDLIFLPERERADEASRLIDEAARHAFDLAEEPLYRFVLLKEGPEKHRLVIVMHRMIGDDKSCEVLLDELLALYEGFGAAGPPSLPVPTLQYSDFARWQREAFSTEKMKKHLHYWGRRCAGGLPVLDVASDFQRPAAKTYAGSRHPVRISEKLTQGLRALGDAENTSLSMVLLTAFFVLLHRYTGQEDLAVGVSVSGRDWRGAEKVVGPCSNQLPLRMDLSGDPSFRQLLSGVRDAFHSAREHGSIPLEKLIEDLHPDRDMSRPSLVQAMFQFEEGRARSFEAAGAKFTRLEIEPHICAADLALRFQQHGDCVTGGFDYSTDLFRRETVERMEGHLLALFDSVAEQPDAPISTVSLLPPSERALLEQWSRIASEPPCDRCIHELFEAEAERRPGAVAVTFEGKALTYRELNVRSNQLAHYLRRLGVGPETLVALCMERSLEMVIAILGVLKAGGAYVPLDLIHPRERLKAILDDARCPVLLTHSSLRDRLPEASHAKIVRVDEAFDEIAKERAENPSTGVRPENIAYVIYTSGSTGKPKGTLIPHSNVLRLMKATEDWFRFGENDVWCLFHSYAFDFSVWEIWGPLCYGGRLVIVPYLVSRSPSAFHDLLHDERVTVLNQTPSAFRQLMYYESSLDAARRKPLALRYVIFGGEALDLASLVPWFERHGDARPKLVNMYGITETTVHVTYRPLTMADARAGTGSRIGIPIPHLQLYVLDQHLKPAPIGVPGELFVGGTGLARGYLNRPEMTAQKFIPHPFSGRSGDRLYRTGDLVRYTTDGDLEYLGRIDHQVKLRGFRIELGEIESVLAQHAGVREAVVLLCETGSNDKRLVAYIIYRKDVADADLRGYIRERLPEYMVPAAFVRLGAFPLTANGKLDRRALPKPEWTRQDAGNAYVAPRTEIESALAAIWRDVLGMKQVGVQDSFFDLGGHSLLATQVISRIRDVFKVELSLRVFFESPTVEALAKSIESETGSVASGAPAIAPVPREGPLPCSFAEELLWFLEELSGGFGAYNVPVLLRLRGTLDGSLLRTSLLGVIGRHESLRTRFNSSGGVPVQVIDAEGRLAWTEEDLTGLHAEALRRAEGEACRPFDLVAGPLVRATLYRLSSDEHLLCIVIHHIVFDGWSVGILLRELAACYEGQPLPSLPIQYADYAVWQRSWFRGEALERSLAYWKERLQGPLPVLELATDHARPAAQTFRGGQVCRRMSRDLTDRLRTFSQQESVTLFVTLLSGWATLLHRYTGQEDIITGSAIAGRTRAELEGLIGFFVNTLALRLDLSGDPGFRTLLRRMQQLALEVYEHQETPFETLVTALQPERDLSRSPLFQVLFVFHNTPAPTIQFSGVEGCVEEIHNGGAKFDLTFAITDCPEGLWLALEYNADLFEASTVERMLDHFRTLLDGVVANPDARLAELPLLTSQERHQLLFEWNDTRLEFPRNVCLHQLFEEQTERTPNAVALVFGDERLTYRELNNLANLTARRILELGTGPETLVGIYLERSVEMVVGLLATLKAGGAYVALDPAYPAERLRMMLEDAQITILLTQRKLAGTLPATNARIVCLDEGREVGQDVTFGNPACGVTAENLAYVIYTSGSTGRPKGVAITHHNACAFVHWARSVFDDNDLRGVLASTSICFDLSVFELFVPLSWGGTAILAENVLALPSLPAREEITLINTVPSAMAELVRQGFLPSSVRTVNLAGEPLRPDLVNAVYDLGAERVFDLYGPTETTTYSTFVLREKGGPMTVGRPIANTRIYILDKCLRPSPVGVPGELYIGGHGLARGYLRRPELTSEKFIPDPFSVQPGERLYRTGDLARYRPDGNIELIGRLDYQVKVRGFRVELGEIEMVLSRHECVGEAVVLAREDAPGDKRLVAYIVPRRGGVVDAQSLRTFTREQLPHYMVPSAFVALEAFPLTPNGKVNRRALPAPEGDAFAAATGVRVEPRTDTERVVADIWREVLKIDQIGIHDNFFDLGGHSLLATQVVSRLRSALQIEVPLRKLFEAPTIAALAVTVEEALLEEVETLTENEAVQRLKEDRGP